MAYNNRNGGGGGGVRMDRFGNPTKLTTVRPLRSTEGKVLKGFIELGGVLYQIDVSEISSDSPAYETRKDNKFSDGGMWVKFTKRPKQDRSKMTM